MSQKCLTDQSEQSSWGHIYEYQSGRWENVSQKWRRGGFRNNLNKKHWLDKESQVNSTQVIKNHEIIINNCISGKLLDRMEVYCGKEECCQTTCTKFKITGKFKFWTSWEGRVQSILHNKSWFFWRQYFHSHLCSKYIRVNQIRREDLWQCRPSSPPPLPRAACQDWPEPARGVDVLRPA